MSGTVNHHFIPQFYLRNFSLAGDRRKAKVFTFDQPTRKSFETLVRNVGSRRNFFRVEVEGFDPNHVEDGMAAIEGEIAIHLGEVIASKSFPSDDHFASVLLLMGNVAVRNPRFRSVMERIHVQVAEKMMKLTLQYRDRFEDSVKQARERGAPIRNDISYDEMKAFIDGGEYQVAIDQTYLVELELRQVPNVVEQLARRKWCFTTAAPGTSYITSDDPVILSWIDGNDRGPYPPGFALNGTVVMFALSPELALFGIFETIPAAVAHERDQVAAFNTSVAKYSTKQLYARDGEFELHTKTGRYIRGHDLAARLRRQSNSN